MCAQHWNSQHSTQATGGRKSLPSTPQTQRTAEINAEEIKLPINKCWRRCGERRTSIHCWWEGVKISTASREIGLELSQKIKNGTIISPSYSTPVHILREFHTLPQRYLNSHLYCYCTHYGKAMLLT